MIIDQVLQDSLDIKNGKFVKADPANPPSISNYQPDDATRELTLMILDCFRWADVTMRKPRREYNDYSTLNRMMVDQMSFNAYQPNNGQGYAGDAMNGWKSHAMRPIVRNKAISIAAHATAKLMFPKFFAYDQQSEEQNDAAMVMRDLIEWASEQNDYRRQTMFAVLNALVNPASIAHVEYAEGYRVVKTNKVNGKWNTEKILDKDNSGFKITQVPVDEFYIADFYTEDVQKQEYLIWRRVQTYATMKSKYGEHENFKYVRPGYQVLYNDANVGFYEVYDSNLRGSLCEEIIFYSKALDLQIYIVNGVMLCEPENPNPRIDKNYPFVKFYYEPFDEGRCFYGKSMAFKMQPDADILNTLYPMIIDGTYLNIFSPLIITGEEEIGSDVIIPGVATTLINPTSAVTPLRVAQDIQQGVNMLNTVEESINESTERSLPTGKVTAYQYSKVEQEQATLLGMFQNMIASYVLQYGKLMKSDVLQYLTIPDVNKIIDNGELIYKTFIAHDKVSNGAKRSRKIRFDLNLPDKVTEGEHMNMSYGILEEQGGHESKQELFKVNPVLFRDLDFMAYCSPDIISPMSDDLERAFGLELYDRAIANPIIDQEQITKDFLLGLYPKSQEDTQKYIKKQEPMQPGQMGMPPGPDGQPMPGGQPPQGGPSQPPSQFTKTGAISPAAAMINNPLSTK